MNKQYILKGHEPVLEEDMMEWARWLEVADRTVKRTELPNGLLVSTVFLGLDHNWYDDGEPILFETMIFDGSDKDEYQVRYSTWEEAEAGHEVAVKIAKAKLDKGGKQL